jgi:RNA recognition motif-containing protein
LQRPLKQEEPERIKIERASRIDNPRWFYKSSARRRNMKIYVGNLAYEVTEDELKQEFAAFGEVTSVSIVTDKYTGRPRGFGFVEMAKVSEGQAAITGLNGKAIRERTLAVNEARPRSEDRGSRSYNDRRGGSSGRGRQQRY